MLIIVAVCGILSKRLGLRLVLTDQDGGFAEKILDFGHGWADVLATVLFLAVTVGTAALTYRWIECPGQDVFRYALFGRPDRLGGKTK